jgi:uncharacterized protein
MKPRPHDPRRLNVEAFAAEAGRLDGEWPLSELPRLHDVVPDDAPPEARPVRWSAEGERRRPHAVHPETWLNLHADARIWMTCQRCLLPLAVELDVDRAIRFVEGEAEAERLDAEGDDDVLAIAASFDLQGLLEDELLLALPLVPRHADCRPALPADEAVVADEEATDPAEHPFAKLAVLKREPPR